MRTRPPLHGSVAPTGMMMMSKAGATLRLAVVSESEPPSMLQQAIGHNHNLKDLALFQQPQGFG